VSGLSFSPGGGSISCCMKVPIYSACFSSVSSGRPFWSCAGRVNLFFLRCRLLNFLTRFRSASRSPLASALSAAVTVSSCHCFLSLHAMARQYYLLHSTRSSSLRARASAGESFWIACRRDCAWSRLVRSAYASSVMLEYAHLSWFSLVRFADGRPVSCVLS
jgi:hypothetical protein